ncbi:MAG: hypothetical protein HYY06_23350 [Deltaproteobacteria bacterium]|nr:hypothetical protein [Deltaproteobacteria bacterium]
MRRLAVILGSLAACALPNPEVGEADLDPAMFRCQVEPVLVDRCAFPACHGNPDRAFRVYAPNRSRYGLPGDSQGDPLTEEESALNLSAALGFASPAPGYSEPLLVAKPLDESLGGAWHGGAEQYDGRDVFRDARDPELAVLRVWLDGATEDSSCAP